MEEVEDARFVGSWIHEVDWARVKTGSRGFGGEGKEFMNWCGEVGGDLVETNIV